MMGDVDPDDIDALLAANFSAPAHNLHEESSEAIGAHIVDWRHLADGDASEEWGTLREWVEWFTVRYRVAVSVVPDCWWRHGDLVEELSALHTAHLVAFDSQDTGFGPIGWHERLSLAVPRMQRAGAGCAGGHHSIRPRQWTRATDEREWTAWITQTHARRDTDGVSPRKEEG